jgi:hypothetical protein
MDRKSRYFDALRYRLNHGRLIEMTRTTKYCEEFAHLALIFFRLGATDAELATAVA